MTENQKNQALYFVFMDESGVIHHDPNQPFFAVGALFIEDTRELVSKLAILKRQAIQSAGGLDFPFEFKFKAITRRFRPFFEQLIDLGTSVDIMANIVVVDKKRHDSAYTSRYPNAWDAYIEIAKVAVLGCKDRIPESVVIADFIQKPRGSRLFLETELKTLPGVRNATMLESHASLLIQLIDVLSGCVVYQFRMKQNPEASWDKEKTRVSAHLAKKLEVQTLAEDINVKKPFPFQVMQYEV